MDRQELLRRIEDLRATGRSVRSIAAELGIHRSRVERALKALAQARIEETKATLDTVRSLGSVFVGRRVELDQLKAALDETIAGSGRMVILAGEPGIGKTRTAQELAAYAESHGAQVVWGRCHEGQGAPPYWPWIQIIRSYVRTHDARQLGSEMGSGAADIAEVVPEVRAALVDLELPTKLALDQARFRLFDSITIFLEKAAETQPLVLVLDNLHSADRPSLQLLEFLAKEMSESNLLLVGTYRDVEVTSEHPLAQTLVELTREPLFQQIHLDGLTQKDVEQFIRAAANIEPPQNLVQAVYRPTEGNPLFMIEVVRLLARQGQLVQEQPVNNRDWAISIPGGVRAVIGKRLGFLSQRCHQVLATASIIGREFSRDQLAALMPALSAEELLEVVEEALPTRVIDEMPGPGHRYRFSHVLIQDTLASELSTAKRVRIHSDIGEVLEGLFLNDVEAHADEIAYHFAEAVPLIGVEKLVKYSLLAGDRALATYANEEALVHFQRALAAKGVSLTGLEPAKDAETAALLSGLGRAQSTLQYDGALASLRSAFDYYVESGDVGRVVEIAEFPDYGTGTRSMGMGTIIARALELVPSDSYEAGRLLPRYGQYIGLQVNDYEKARIIFERALVIARREDDIALELRILSAAVTVDVNHLRHAECLEYSLLAITLASKVDDPRSELGARYSAVTSLAATGDLQRALQVATGMLAPAERLRDSFWLAGTYWKNEIIYRLVGDWGTAREFGERGLSVSSNPSLLLQDLSLLEYEVGNFSSGRMYLDRLLENANARNPQELVDFSAMEFAMVSMVLSLTARTTNNRDELALAESTGGTVLASSNVPPSGTVRARTALAMVSVMGNDPVKAAEHYGALAPLRGILLFFTINSDRLLGLLSQTMGNPVLAAEHFEDALAFSRKAGYRPELAWTCYDYADMLLQGKYEGDHAKAMAMLEESLAISTELGMRPLRERVITLKEWIESQPGAAPVYPDGLTEREVEVLRLVAAGKSNPEIGDELLISFNTVANHVRNILSKTNSPNRVAAAGYAMQRGLTS